ncbi:hypothetical protein CYLTODRAFT_380908 [Cylindrobasidium torrendii FP15055 ss-10]|uniref:Amino acid transporter transmembrane domain-containing protein n=1 Tax=Cylindrobasidium torrendii FP15055 ss-10 TaxID=1314674 RepID=A0A0D7B2M1_9AGAR|nr:hypothetical protein CYLTODRAFT_380908 [Cylindrobasidium torrendii FP15055 ss-10]
MSTPVNIRGRPAMPESSSANSTPIGTPELRALRAQYGATGTTPGSLSIPPRSVPLRTGSPANSFGAPSNGSAPSVGGISVSQPQPEENGLPPNLEELPEEEKLRVLRRHLVHKDERKQSSTDLPGTSTSTDESEAFPIPYEVPGADVTHDIYKYNQRKARSRAASYAATPAPVDPAFEHIHEPGGFRRNYVMLHSVAESGEEPQFAHNFIDFLYLFGHFAGEDLEEDEEEDTDAPAELEPTEEAPLLGAKPSSRSRSRSKRRATSPGPHGTATVTQAVLMLLKAFIGTGVLFLGRGFYNGGILFSSLLFVFIAAVSLYSFILLVRTKFVVSGSFGDIGGTLYGNWMRMLILGSIVVSQIGFCGAYIIFVSENLQAFVQGITHCAQVIGIQYFIIIQAVIFLPLVLIRDLAKLSTTALVADAFILAGLIYIFSSEVTLIAQRGTRPVELFNPKDFPLFVGTAVFSFEGIGLVIPITDAMREPKKFPKVISWVMLGLTILFGGAGALAYLTFGADIQTVVLVNLDTKKPMVQAVQFLYSLAIMLSVPLQLFPAVRIMENGLFVRSGKTSTRVKWLKNLFRWCCVGVTAIISWLGAADLDKFVAFVGCFACVPLCYVYPAMLHYKAVSRTRGEKAKDLAMMVFGMIAAVYTSVQTIKLMLEPVPPAAPGRCDVAGGV